MSLSALHWAPITEAVLGRGAWITLSHGKAMEGSEVTGFLPKDSFPPGFTTTRLWLGCGRFISAVTILSEALSKP